MLTIQEFLALNAEERTAHLATLTTEQLGEFEQALLAHFDEVMAQPPTVERNAELTEVRNGIAETRGLVTAAAEEQQRLEDEAAALAEEVIPAPEPVPAPVEPTAEETPTPAEEPAPAAEPETPAEPVAVDAPAEPAAPAPAAEPVRPAAAARRPAFPTNTHRPAAAAPPARRAHGGHARMFLTPNGQDVTSVDQVAQAMVAIRERFGPVPRGHSENVGVARIEYDYPQERRLTAEQTPTQVQELVAAAVSERVTTVFDAPIEELVAAGVACAPFQISYDIPTLGDAGRPWLSGLTPFQLSRAGIRARRAMTLSDVDDMEAVGDWTLADDEAALTDPDVRKPCARIECPDLFDAEVEAITKCLTIGNLMARTDPELVRAITELTDVVFARHAESKITNAVAAGSVHVEAERVLGVTRDILANITYLAASTRWAERMDENAPLEWWGPTWAFALIQVDMARQMPGGPVDPMSITRAQVIEWFRARNIIPNFFRDGEVGQNLTRQQGGALNTLPATLVWYMFPAGTWVVLDQGTLDLGLVRDSTLNGTNDYQLFSEKFEAAVRLGPISYRLEQPACPTGSSGGTEDIVDTLNCLAVVGS